MKRNYAQLIMWIFLLGIAPGSYAQETRLSGTVKIHPWINLPVVISTDMKGGLQSLGNIGLTDSPAIVLNSKIPAFTREIGMVISVLDSDKGNKTRYFEYLGTDNWIEIFIVNAWETNHLYNVGDYVAYNGNFYIANASFITSTFATDSTKWNNAGGVNAKYTASEIKMDNRSLSKVAARGAIVLPENEDKTIATVGYVNSANPGVAMSASGVAPITLSMVSNNLTASMPPATNTTAGYTPPEMVQAIEANTAKITNATHTGDVTGSDALTITDKAVSLSKMSDIPATAVIGRNSATSGTPQILSPSDLRSMLKLTDSLNFNTNRPITLTGTNTTGLNLGAGRTMSEFFEAFFFPAIPATPPTSTFSTSTTTFPYSTWKSWPSYIKSDLSFLWNVTNVSQSDGTDDKLITSIKFKSGATILASVTPTGTTQGGTFTNVSIQNTNGNVITDFTKTYSLEVIDAQPNTVIKNVLITLSKAIRLTYGAPTLAPATTVYEYDLTNKVFSINWSITPNDEAISSISVDGVVTGSTAATGSQNVTFKTIANGGVQSKVYPLIVTGNLYGAGTVQNSPAVSWDNRLYRGVITSAFPPSDPSFTFSDTQIKTELLTENKLGGNWKAAAGYDFVCNPAGQYVVFAYPNDAVTPVVQYWDSNFSTWMTYPATDLKIIDRANFINQNGYSGTNYRLVVVCVQYVNATVKIRLQ